MRVIGAVFIDIKGYSHVAYVPEGRNIGDVVFMEGGVCRNVAENLANIGQPVSFVSAVDGDALGEGALRRLNEIGVDVADVIRAPNGMGMWLVILDQNGACAGSISRQPDFAPLLEHIRAMGDRLADDDICLEIDTTEEIARTVLDIAARNHRKVYGIIANMGVALAHPELLSRLACFICNDIEAGRLFGRARLIEESDESLMRIVSDCSKTLKIPAMVVTLGGRGCVYVDHISGERGILPALPVEVVDSTGAGDAFFTGTVTMLHKGKPLSEAVKYGTKLAAATLRVKSASVPKETLP